MAAPTRAASAPIAPATGAFLKAAPERLDEAVELVGVPVPLGLEVVEGREVVGAVVPVAVVPVAVVLGAEILPETESEVAPEAAPLETMGRVTVSIQQ